MREFDDFFDEIDEDGCVHVPRWMKVQNSRSYYFLRVETNKFGQIEKIYKKM